MEDRIGPDVAESEFQRWVDAMYLTQKLDPTRLDAEERKNLAQQKNVILDALVRGDLVVNEDGCFVFTPSGEKESRGAITIPEPTWDHLRTGTDGKGENAGQGKMMGMFSKVTQIPEERLKKLKLRDVAVCQAVMALFLG